MSLEQKKKPGFIKQFFINRKEKKEKQKIIGIASKINKDRIHTKKLEEELRKMTKLELVDGKLEPVQVEQKLGAAQPVPQPLQPNTVIPQHEVPAPPPLFTQQAPMQEPMMPPLPDISAPPPEMQMPPPEIPPQQFSPPRQQPQYFPPPQHPLPVPPRMPELVTVTLRMVEGIEIKVSVNGEAFETFTTRLDEAISEQSTFQVENQIINGRHIISYTFM